MSGTKRNRTLLFSLLGATLFWLGAPILTAQADTDEGSFLMADASPLTEAEMGELRGGFMDPSGLFLRFAVDVRTLVDGSVTFVRSLVLEPDSSGHLQATTTAQTLPQNLPGGMSISQIGDGKGVVITDGQGRTTALNQTSQGLFANVILNTASNRDVTQNMNIDIVLRNMQNVAGAAFNGAGQGLGMTALAQSARSPAAGFRF